MSMATGTTCMKYGDDNAAHVVLFGSKARLNQCFSNLYRCTIPVAPVCAQWARDNRFTPRQIGEMLSLAADDATWPSAEAAYQSAVFARGYFDGHLTESDTPLQLWTEFFTGGRFTMPANLESAVDVVDKKPIVSPQVAQNIVKAFDKGHPIAAGKAVKLFMRQWPMHEHRPTLVVEEQAILWAPIHDAKFGPGNPELAAALGSVVAMEYTTVFVELGSTAMHQKRQSWGAWGGGIRTEGPVTTPGDEGTTYGFNYMGQILSVCAHRLFKVPLMQWLEPTERYKTRGEITAMKERAGVARVPKRKARVSGKTKAVAVEVAEIAGKSGGKRQCVEETDLELGAALARVRRALAAAQGQDHMRICAALFAAQ